MRLNGQHAGDIPCLDGRYACLLRGTLLLSLLCNGQPGFELRWTQYLLHQPVPLVEPGAELGQRTRGLASLTDDELKRVVPLLEVIESSVHAAK